MWTSGEIKAMKLIKLLPVVSLVLGSLSGPSALPMTDYSQLNHDEPTHWTKAATTHAPSTTEWKDSTVTTTDEIDAIVNSSSTLTTVVSETIDSSTEASLLVDSVTDYGAEENESTQSYAAINTKTTTKEDSQSTTEILTGSYNYDDVDDKPTNFDHYYRYDLVDEARKGFSGDNDIVDKGELSNNYDNRQLPRDYNFESEQEEEEMKRSDIDKKVSVPGVSDAEESYDLDTPFKKWDRDSEEQERLLENIVFQANNDTLEKMEIERRGEMEGQDDQAGSGRWFLLLLAGNSTIVKLRQKDFAKYLKLNLAARLSLEYDEVKLNKVVLAPPRLMVNVSVVPSGMGNLDDEFDLNERLFGEEEAPLHKLAETNATLLELSGEEYHVVRFLSLRSQQPLAMDEAASETNVVVTDRHADIEHVIYIVVGSACLFLVIRLIITLCRSYLIPWKRDKPLFFPGGAAPWSLPRHQRMEEPTPINSTTASVIYSGSFVERNGPPSGSWIEDNYQGSSSSSNALEPNNLDNPLYGYDKPPNIYDPTVLDSPRFNVESRLRILGCRPNHLLIPQQHTPIKKKGVMESKTTNLLDVRIPKGLDNPNYQT